MPHRYALALRLDPPQRRVKRRRLHVFGNGTNWDENLSQNVLVLPSGTAIARPFCWDSTWETSFPAVGNYARIGLAGHTVATPAQWTEVPRQGVGDIFLESTTGEKATVTAAMEKNQPMYLRVYVPGVESLGERTVLTFGWGVQGAAGSVWVRLRANDTWVVYKGSEQVGVYSGQDGAVIEGKKKPGQQPGGLARRTLAILALPHRRRDLEIVTNSAGSAGVVHTFSDLDALGLSNTITPAGQFWWQVPAGLRASVQVAKVKFMSGARLYGPLRPLRWTINSPRTWLARWGGDPLTPVGGAAIVPANPTLYVENQAGIVVGDIAAPPSGGFVTTTGARVRVDIPTTLDNAGTWGIHAFHSWTGPEESDIDLTYNAPIDIACTLQPGLTIRVPETGPATAEWTTDREETLTALGVAQPAVTMNRPFDLKIGAVTLLRGTCSPVDMILSEGDTRTTADEIGFTAADDEARMLNVEVPSPIPYDGAPLSDAAADVPIQAGIDPAELDVPADAFTLPYYPSVASGSYQVWPEDGEVLERILGTLQEEFAYTYLRGWYPSAAGPKWRFVDPAAMSATPDIHLFQSDEDALAAGVAAADVPYRTISRIRRKRVLPICNQVLIEGEDPHTGSAVWGQYDDAASQAAGTAPAARPENWLGEVVTEHAKSDLITTVASAVRAAGLAGGRITKVRKIVELDAGMLIAPTNVPLWRHARARLWAPGRGSYEDLRIVQIPSLTYKGLDIDTDADVWECTYSGEAL
jgi:hypothetical protein